jgi:metal-responsive CopG/Arc/MetJ family transcriptional regulator
VKTAVSLPDKLFDRAEVAAKKLRLSRSRLYATALADFLERQRSGDVTRRLNKVYSRRAAKVDPAVARAQLKSLPKDSW